MQKDTADMDNAANATVARSTAAGRFTIRKANGEMSEHASGKKTSKIVRRSISKNRAALQRLANR
ncbi:hypothetical protein [uncultured Tateyamaria sp.]|uniref:hypothetical protein n=1 Tax=uncultured Tateyamaria sp. TaxID=455651 RepID=UPI0026272D39|nr:hypothetical protein [uncultured Tateyamaria sp.]